MRIIFSALIVSVVLLAWGLPSVPAQAAEQRGKPGSSHQQGKEPPRDARDDKEPTAQDQNTKPSRDTSGLKDTSHQPKSQGSKDSRNARDDKEAGHSSME